MKKKLLYSLNDLTLLVAEFQIIMQTHRIFAFNGCLGAGKTTLVRSLLHACGVTGVISSPTFTYVNIYTSSKGVRLYHFDLYRLTDIHEFLDAGFDEYFHDPDAYLFIEWPEIIKPLLKNSVCFVSLEYSGPDTRSISLETSSSVK